jgi:hypothetical protein
MEQKLAAIIETQATRQSVVDEIERIGRSRTKWHSAKQVDSWIGVGRASNPGPNDGKTKTLAIR